MVKVQRKEQMTLHWLQKLNTLFINFSEQEGKFCLSLLYNRANKHTFVNGGEIYKFKAKNFEINAALLCLGNASNNFSVDNIKNPGLYVYFYDFSVY